MDFVRNKIMRKYKWFIIFLYKVNNKFYGMQWSDTSL